GSQTNLTIQVERTDGKPLQLTKATSRQAGVQAAISNGDEANPNNGAIQLEIKADGA
ncbi:MAG: hypothetical protein GTO53_06285, partial [Planctomycetales bacterium]|nr:hypothetical protein [Planctomycetales bacterium]NIN77567.1 hypothetical protein [Planctomycetales bacterium]